MLDECPKLKMQKNKRGISVFLIEIITLQDSIYSSTIRRYIFSNSTSKTHLTLTVMAATGVSTIGLQITDSETMMGYVPLKIQHLLPGELVSYKYFDTLCDATEAVNYPTEFLNSLDLPAMPPHYLQLKLVSQCFGEPIGPTTEYAVISKTSSVTSRSNNTNHLPSLPSSRIVSSAQNSKLSKRAGVLSDSKVKGDHVSDSTAYIPITSYRPSRLHLPAHEQYVATSLAGHKNYHSVIYDNGNWKPDNWELDYTKKNFLFNSTRVQHIEAECQDDYMKIRIGFNGSFDGVIYSAGYAYDPDCMYINGTGNDYYEFYIQLNRCGTLGKNALHDEKRRNPTNFMWNTVTVQYNPLIEEEFDEHFKVTCEYGYDFWKTVTFPFLDVEVATGNPVVFTLSPPECYMEIQNGYGIGGPRVTEPVRVGDPLTLIIYMRSKYEGFDIVVNDCFAHNGANKRIQLIDEYGCPINEKLISRFRGSWSDGSVYETQVYAYVKTFRFTGSPALYIECDVRMCHGKCANQPCHWRNLKAITKREVVNSTTSSPSNGSLSENINLFQSLRVLQEEDEEAIPHRHNRGSEICLAASLLSSLTAATSLIVCILSALLLLSCLKLKNLTTQTSGYESYVTHKEQIS